MEGFKQKWSSAVHQRRELCHTYVIIIANHQCPEALHQFKLIRVVPRGSNCDGNKKKNTKICDSFEFLIQRGR